MLKQFLIQKTEKMFSIYNVNESFMVFKGVVPPCFSRHVWILDTPGDTLEFPERKRSIPLRDNGNQSRRFSLFWKFSSTTELNWDNTASKNLPSDIIIGSCTNMFEMLLTVIARWKMFKEFVRDVKRVRSIIIM